MVCSLCGSHGTGKSTLGPLLVASLNALSNEQWAFVPEIAREVLDEKGITENLGLLPVEKIIEVQEEILRRKIEERNKHNDYVNLIEDRHPLLDVFAYSTYWLSRHPSADNFLSRIQEQVKNKEVESDLILLIPPNIPHEKDGVRAESPHFRETVHHVITGILTNYAYNYFQIYESCLENRLQDSLKLIKAYGTSKFK